MQNRLPLSTVALPLCCLVSACATTAKPPLHDGSVVALGQRAYVDGPLIQPIEVLEDSRCPMNARCVWAGRVRVKMMWLRPTGERQPFELTLGQPTQLADGQITLESVRPDKRTDLELKPSDYRFSFRFAGGL